MKHEFYIIKILLIMEFSNFESDVSPFMTSEKDIGLVSSEKNCECNEFASA